MPVTDFNWPATSTVRVAHTFRYEHDTPLYVIDGMGLALHFEDESVSSSIIALPSVHPSPDMAGNRQPCLATVPEDRPAGECPYGGCKHDWLEQVWRPCAHCAQALQVQAKAQAPPPAKWKNKGKAKPGGRVVQLESSVGPAHATQQNHSAKGQGKQTKGGSLVSSGWVSTTSGPDAQVNPTSQVKGSVKGSGKMSSASACTHGNEGKD